VVADIVVVVVTVVVVTVVVVVVVGVVVDDVMPIFLICWSLAGAAKTQLLQPLRSVHRQIRLRHPPQTCQPCNGGLSYRLHEPHIVERRAAAAVVVASRRNRKIWNSRRPYDHDDGEGRHNHRAVPSPHRP